MAAKTCEVCGKPSGMYPLCPACFKLKDEGKVIKCEKCNKWHKISKPCDCSTNNIATSTETTTEKNTSECIICKAEANGQLFCKSCYYKYKDKVLLLKISKCKDIELMDEAYEGKFICTDGHIVKSKSERDIDNYLYHKNIPHAYEKTLVLDEFEEHNLHPDFYLSNEDIYIEHWGFDESNKAYTDSKKYKIEKYKNSGITVVCTNEKDALDINAQLDRKLQFYKKNQINFL